MSAQLDRIEALLISVAKTLEEFASLQLAQRQRRDTLPEARESSARVRSARLMAKLDPVKCAQARLMSLDKARAFLGVGMSTAMLVKLAYRADEMPPPENEARALVQRHLRQAALEYWRAFEPQPAPHIMAELERLASIRLSE